MGKGFLYLSHILSRGVHVRGLNFGLSLPQFRYCVYARSQGSAETACIGRLV